MSIYANRDAGRAEVPELLTDERKRVARCGDTIAVAALDNLLSRVRAAFPHCGHATQAHSVIAAADFAPGMESVVRALLDDSDEEGGAKC